MTGKQAIRHIASLTCDQVRRLLESATSPTVRLVAHWRLHERKAFGALARIVGVDHRTCERCPEPVGTPTGRLCRACYVMAQTAARRQVWERKRHAAAITAACLCLFAGPAFAQYTPGVTYGWPSGCDLASTCQLELIAGDLPIIYETPHGGDRSFGWPVRTTAACGVTANPFNNGTDTNTLQQANSLDFYYGLTGRHPWVLKSRILRSRLDLNRPLAGGACGYAPAMAAWTRYHEWLMELFALVSAQHGRTLHVSLHGHADEKRLYLDIGISHAELTAANLDDLGPTSTLASWLPVEGVSFTEILRSLGTELTFSGKPTVPAWQDHTTEPGEVWPSTGWTLQQYGCPNVSALVCSLQVELPYTGWRDTQANRGAFSLAFREALRAWLAPFGVTW